MNIQRFFGKNSKLALVKVREVLGEDAIILSNRAINGGNEIMAFSSDDIDSIPTYDNPVATATAKQQANTASSSNSNVINDIAAKQAAPVIEDAQSSTLDALFRKRLQDANTRAENNQRAQLTTPVNAAPTANTASSTKAENMEQKLVQLQSKAQSQEVNKQIKGMMNEIRNMRSEIESQLSKISWDAAQQREPLKAKILSNMLTAGFSSALAKQISSQLPPQFNEKEASQWMQAVLLKNLNTMPSEAELLSKGGIYAIVGPTGVGKTTTTAKMAARYVMKHGAENIGLISTDSYRVGGHEQLRMYGKILGVMVHNVKDEDDLKLALHSLKDKHLILIDTVGVSQRDQMVSSQIAMLSANKAIKKLLCLNATNSGDTLVDVINAYRGRNLDGFIMTKMDEATTIGSVLDVVIREKQKLFYVTNGQRVPENIHLPHKKQLIHRAFSNRGKSDMFNISQSDLPLVLNNKKRTAKPTLAELNHA